MRQNALKHTMKMTQYSYKLGNEKSQHWKVPEALIDWPTEKSDRMTLCQLEMG